MAALDLTEARQMAAAAASTSNAAGALQQVSLRCLMLLMWLKCQLLRCLMWFFEVVLLAGAS